MRAVWIFMILAGTLRADEGGPCDSGDAKFRRQAYAEAQDALWKCVVSGAPSRDFAHQLTLTYRELKNYESAWAQVQEAIALQPDSIDLLYVAGFLQFRLGKHRESIESLGKAFRLDPSDWRVHHLFALNYVVLDIKDGALEGFRTAIALNPGNAELHYHLARFYYSDNRIAESISSSGKALSLFPEYPEVHDNLGLCYEALAENEKARASFEFAIALSEKFRRGDEWPYLNYAAFLIKQGFAAESLPPLEKALGRNPGSAKARYLQGRAFRALHRTSEARAVLEKSIQLDPKDAPSHYELGMLLIKEGERARGKALLARFEALRKGRP